MNAPCSDDRHPSCTPCGASVAIHCGCEPSHPLVYHALSLASARWARRLRPRACAWEPTSSYPCDPTGSSLPGPDRRATAVGARLPRPSSGPRRAAMQATSRSRPQLVLSPAQTARQDHAGPAPADGIERRKSRVMRDPAPPAPSLWAHRARHAAWLRARVARARPRARRAHVDPVEGIGAEDRRRNRSPDRPWGRPRAGRGPELSPGRAGGSR